jgi:hypothetical protein
MSTTVIVSPYRTADLYLRPWSKSSVDLAAVGRILEDHGLELVDLDALARGIEGVAAVGLPVGPATALARDLRAAGLTVRVVNDPHITQNARVATAVAVLFMLAMLSSPLILPALLALFNAIYISSRGRGLGAMAALPSPGAARVGERPERLALARIRDLAENLPPHVLQPLIARAEDLARDASRDPDGAAARGLSEIVADLQREHDQRITDEARALKADLARARRAVREVP